VIGSGYAPERVSKLSVGQGHDDAALAKLLSESVPVSALPASLDWREKGVVTAVKDQGGCGGCWSFSAAETTESAVAIATGKLLIFSEQELLACTQNPNNCGGTGGCSGATQELAFQAYVNNSITLEKDYPYQAQTTKCEPSKIKPVANITGYVIIPFNNYTATMNAVATVGPIAISGAAEPWQLYSSGVFHSNCGADVDHAIQLVGYGHDASAKLDYYLVRCVARQRILRTRAPARLARLALPPSPLSAHPSPVPPPSPVPRAVTRGARAGARMATSASRATARAPTASPA